MPGESVGAGTRMGAMSGSSTTPAVLYAHWTRTPVVDFYINGTTSYQVLVKQADGTWKEEFVNNVGIVTTTPHRQALSADEIAAGVK